MVTPPPDQDLLALAHRIDARMRQRSVVRRQTCALDAFDLAQCKRLGLFRLLGYSSVTTYAREVNGFSSSKTSDLIRIAEACARLPQTKAAFLSGELDWCAAREVAKRATPEDEGHWLELARRLNVSELAARAREEDPLYRRVLELKGEELAWVEDVAQALRRELGPMPLGKAVAEACRRLLEEGRSGAGGSGYRIVYHECKSCGAATRETSEGSVPVGPEDLELARCDAEVLDLTNGPARVVRTPPPKIKNYVLGRDKSRCVVPGCRNPADHFHHEKGWRSGHDPAFCFGLCGSHHRARHDDCLRVEGAWPDLRFFLKDGTFLGTAGGEREATATGSASLVSSCEEAAPADGEAKGSLGEGAPGGVEAEGLPHEEGRGSSREEAPADVGTEGSSHEEAEGSSCEDAPGGDEEAESSSPKDPVKDALGALRSLEFKPSEAKRRVRRVLRRHPGRSWEAGDLVRAVLLELPSPGFKGLG